VTAKNKIRKHRRQRKTSMRDEAVWVEMGKTCSPNGPTWDPMIGRRDLGRPKTRCSDVFKKTFGGRWSVDRGRWTVDGGRARHKAGHHGKRPKGDSQQEAEYIPLHEQISGRGLLVLSLLSRRPLPQRNFILIHLFIHSMVYSSVRQLSTCYVYIVRFIFPIYVRIILFLRRVLTADGPHVSSSPVPIGGSFTCGKATC